MGRATKQLGAALVAITMLVAGLVGVSAAPAAAADGSISGTVTAAVGGAPLQGICVAAYQRDLTGDSTVLTKATTAADGTYTLTLTGAPTNVDVHFSGAGSGFCAGGVAQNVIAQWWNNQPTEATATAIDVATGATGVNAALVAGSTISGTVTKAAGGGSAGAGVCVASYKPGLDNQLEASTSTNANGTYALTGVPVGNHVIQFYGTSFCPGGAPSDYVWQWWDHKLIERSANPVHVNTPGETVANVNASLSLGGTIAGKVTALATGNNIRGICVSALTHGVQPEQLVASTSSATDGTYKLTGVPAGDVDVQFYSSGFCPGGIPSNYSTALYNGNADPSGVTPVHVTVSNTTASINAALGTGGSITGTVTADGGGSLTGICVRAYAHGGTQQLAFTGTLGGGTYTLDGVPAGTVDVRFDASGGCSGGIQGNYVTEWYNDHLLQTYADGVTVADGIATPNINAALAASGTITGTVLAGGNGTSGLCVSAHDPISWATFINTATAADGTYTLDRVPPGDVKVSFDASGACPPDGVNRPNLATEWFNNKTTIQAADLVTVVAGSTTPNVDGSLVAGTSFTTTVNSGVSASIHRGEVATLSEVGLPGAATGTVVFSSSGHPNLCTITLPATNCHTSATLPIGAYGPITAVYTPANANFTGSTSANSVALTVLAAAPGVPTHVHAAPGNGKVIVSWSAPANNGGSSITGYTVTTTPGGKSVSAPANATSANVTGLKPGTYRFTVRAKNGAGSGAWSASSNAITIQAATVTPPPTHKPRVGYWMLGSDGHVYAFGNAKQLGNGAGPTAMASRLDGNGYWVVDATGKVSHFGTAADHGGRPALRFGERVSAMSATPSGNGYWLFTNLGRAFAYGDAHFYGDMRSTPLNGAVIASAATATGHGYYMVGSDGGVFTFGDAKFRGSTGSMRLDKPVVGISPTPDNRGYWLVASDGGVFAFNAPFRGSMGGTHLNKPVNGLVAFGNGYLMVASDGGVFDFSNKPFLGSLAKNPPFAPIIGISAFTTN